MTTITFRSDPRKGSPVTKALVEDVLNNSKYAGVRKSVSVSKIYRGEAQCSFEPYCEFAITVSDAFLKRIDRPVAYINRLAEQLNSDLRHRQVAVDNYATVQQHVVLDSETFTNERDIALPSKPRLTKSAKSEFRKHAEASPASQPAAPRAASANESPRRPVSDFAYWLDVSAATMNPNLALKR